MTTVFRHIDHDLQPPRSMNFLSVNGESRPQSTMSFAENNRPQSAEFLTGSGNERPPNYFSAISSGQIFTSPISVISKTANQRGRSVKPFVGVVQPGPKYYQRSSVVAPEITIKQPDHSAKCSWSCSVKGCLKSKLLQFVVFLTVLVSLLVVIVCVIIYGITPCSLTRCGGTLINRKTILTAAHCNVESFDYEHEGRVYDIPVELNSFYPTRESMFNVYVGVHNRSNMNDLPAKKYTVSKLILHEEYDDKNILNDLAILKLEEEVELNEYVQIACLPLANFNRTTYPSTSPTRSAWIVGWGTTNQYGASSQVLKNARVTVYSQASCKDVLPRSAKNWEAQICAGDVKGYVDTCQGDSGGSLYVNDVISNQTRFFTAGVVSYGEGCAKVDHPGIYTRTSYYMDWIFSHADF